MHTASSSCIRSRRENCGATLLAPNRERASCTSPDAPTPWPLGVLLHHADSAFGGPISGAPNTLRGHRSALGPHYASTPSTARRRHTFGSLPKVWVGGASHSLGSHSFTPPCSAGHPSLETLLPPHTCYLLWSTSPTLILHNPQVVGSRPPLPFDAALSTARWRHTLRVPAKSVGWRGCLFFFSLHLFSGDFPHKLHRSASLLQRHIDGIPPRRKPLRHPLRRFLRCRSKRRVPHGAPADQCHSPSPAALAAASAWTASGSASATLAPSPLPSSATTICPCPCKDMQKPTLRSAAECEADRACQPGPFIPIVTPPVHFTRPLALHCPRFGHPLQPHSRRQRPLRRHLRGSTRFGGTRFGSSKARRFSSSTTATHGAAGSGSTRPMAPRARAACAPSYAPFGRLASCAPFGGT